MHQPLHSRAEGNWGGGIRLEVMQFKKCLIEFVSGFFFLLQTSFLKRREKKPRYLHPWFNMLLYNILSVHNALEITLFTKLYSSNIVHNCSATETWLYILYVRTLYVSGTVDWKRRWMKKASLMNRYTLVSCRMSFLFILAHFKSRLKMWTVAHFASSGFDRMYSQYKKLPCVVIELPGNLYDPAWWYMLFRKNLFFLLYSKVCV